jgi:hypothetical protein
MSMNFAQNNTHPPPIYLFLKLDAYRLFFLSQNNQKTLNLTRKIKSARNFKMRYELKFNLKNSTNLNQTQIKMRIKNKKYLPCDREVSSENQMLCLFVSGLLLWSTCFGCSCLRYDQQMTPSAGIYARTGTRRERS